MSLRTIASPRPARRAPAAAALAALALAAGAARAETLGDVVAYAYQANPGIQAQRAAMRALDESYVSARSGFQPNVSVSGGFTDYWDKRSGATAQANTTSQALSVVQPVYTGGRVTSRVREAEGQIKAGRASLRHIEQDLLTRVVAAYVGVRRDQQIFQVADDMVRVLTKELANTQARFDVREVTLTDLSQAKARLAQAKTQLLTAQAALGASRAQFLGVVGRPPGELAPPPLLGQLPATADAAFDAAEANNPQLESARYAEESSRAAIAEARAARRPTVTARMDWQRTPFVPYLNTPYDDIRSASINLSQPIFSGGQIASDIRRAVETNNRDRLAIDDTRLGVLQETATDWEQLVALRQQLTTAQDEMRADVIAFAGARQEQKAALRSTIEVLNAALELSTAEQNVARVRSAEYQGRVQLLSAMGVLTPQMLSAAVPEYDPAKNFRRIENAGATPLEIPARVIERVASPPIGHQGPASLADARPPASPLPPPPIEAEMPIVSIYATVEEAPTPAPVVEKPAAPAKPKPAAKPAKR